MGTIPSYLALAKSLAIEAIEALLAPENSDTTELCRAIVKILLVMQCSINQYRHLPQRVSWDGGGAAPREKTMTGSETC